MSAGTSGALRGENKIRAEFYGEIIFMKISDWWQIRQSTSWGSQQGRNLTQTNQNPSNNFTYQWTPKNPFAPPLHVNRTNHSQHISIQHEMEHSPGPKTHVFRIIYTAVESRESGRKGSRFRRSSLELRVEVQSQTFSYIFAPFGLFILPFVVINLPLLIARGWKILSLASHFRFSFTAQQKYIRGGRQSLCQSPYNSFIHNK